MATSLIAFEVFLIALTAREGLSADDRYIGCFKDEMKRDLSHYNDLGERGNGPEQCIARCRSKGYKYAGLQYRSQCFCGNRYGIYGERNIRECDTFCVAASHYRCGGAWRNSVYRTGYVKDERYLGCFADKMARDLSHFVDQGVGNSPASCIAHCAHKGYSYAGVQYSTQCLCGNRYGTYGIVGDNECYMRCPAVPGLNCGGPWRNSIYKTKHAVETNADQYLGCFIDQSTRDLEEFHELGKSNKPQLCIARCRKRGYKYAGVQYGTQCFCDNNHGSYGRVEALECDKPCPGDKTVKCGGTWRNSVYKTELQADGRLLGCFIDNHIRDLPYFADLGQANNPSTCIFHCENLGYDYAGLQSATQCFCGDEYGSYEAVNIEDCSANCPAAPGLKCGGTWRNSVYQAKLRKPQTENCD